ncbi:UDP-N-acetylmuramoyl-L-alanyl-D-glutamate--2,6-diaminopimelate ligase MurE [Planctomycetes bacterium Poly30]|uniref:UDP-N-acetylmuramoyl-L-alanyl-D-glutamate--2,6-diaminopimelate ligase n=1 Tax=Saltatorellus ferox TaxID=2528018 RepID=A0A518EVU8_9BACT|nr:UDP-N-acetylmuramoyl-L-alanyl-D-glutamate--2,6-diaminopimelate ligase MurE [Planctomycetes bacterium Poly30]
MLADTSIFGSAPQGPSFADLVEAHGGLVLARSARGHDVTVAANDPRLQARPGDVHIHSGSVHSGDLFAALPGLRADGVRFVPDAVSRGAGLVLLPAHRSVDVLRRSIASAPRALNRPSASGSAAPLLWVHPRAAEILGDVAAHVHGRPANSLRLAGVTGTNGKTSVCHLASQLLQAAGKAPAILGTAGHTLRGTSGPLHLEASHTTPDATAIQRLLARHLRGGGDCAVMEASSHALVQGRLAGMRLQVGAFTNLTREHLDYHGTMERYAEAKARLWDRVAADGHAVIFGTGPASEDMAQRAVDRGLRVIRVAVEAEGDLVARGLQLDERGARFTLSGMGFGDAEIVLPLRGAHNVENALVSTAIARCFGAGAEDLVAGLGALSAAPGRLEAVPLPKGGFDVLVDYAHSPDALERVLVALRADMRGRASGKTSGRTSEKTGEGRLICVFGCGGDRDRGKRGPMGRAVGELSDVAIITSDNPRGERPEDIAEAVIAGVDEVGGRRIVELDRARAIERALGIARPGDVVLIAGKGHENTQVIGGRSLPFDDRVVASEAFARMMEVAR